MSRRISRPCAGCPAGTVEDEPPISPTKTSAASRRVAADRAEAALAIARAENDRLREDLALVMHEVLRGNMVGARDLIAQALGIASALSGQSESSATTEGDRRG